MCLCAHGNRTMKDYLEISFTKKWPEGVMVILGSVESVIGVVRGIQERAVVFIFSHHISQHPVILLHPSFLFHWSLKKIIKQLQCCIFLVLPSPLPFFSFFFFFNHWLSTRVVEKWEPTCLDCIL